MNVANLELCKELYELSDWNDTEYSYIHDMHFDIWDIAKGSPKGDESWEVAAYNLDYLIRKLPEIRLETWHNGHVVIKHYTANGVPSKLERKGDIIKAEADNLEDAACKLAIDLFEQGILTI